MSHSKKAIFSVLSLAFPIIIENILQTLLGTTDTYFAGQLTDTAIAGISVTNIVMNIFISFFTAISIGTTAIVSRNYGKKDFSKANHSIAQALLLAVFLGGAVGLLCLLFYKPILRLSGADATVMRYAAPYFLIVAVPSVFLCLQQVLASCLRAMQDTRSPLYATGTANLLNIILNACFIHWGWGVVGLALATTLSRIISMLLLFYRLYHHDPRITLRLADFKIHKKTMQALLTVGIPAGVEKLIMRIGQLIYNGMIISIGVNAYVAHNIAGTIESYSYIPAMGFGLAISTLVGTALGEQNPRQAVQNTWLGYLLSTLCMVVIGALFYIFASPLAALFTSTTETQDMVVSVLRIIALFQPFSALVQVMTSALQGADDTKFPMYATLIGIWGIRLGIGYGLAVSMNLGLQGVWYAYALDLVVRGIILLIRFQRGKWQSIAV